MGQFQTGGEVDTNCPRCGMSLAHTIRAMNGSMPADVICNTCHHEHRYRAASARRTAAPPPRVAPTAQETWSARAKGKDLAQARPYHPLESFNIGDIIEHRCFGIGIVERVRSNKMDVVFRSETKTLVRKP